MNPPQNIPNDDQEALVPWAINPDRVILLLLLFWQFELTSCLVLAGCNISWITHDRAGWALPASSLRSSGTAPAAATDLQSSSDQTLRGLQARRNEHGWIKRSIRTQKRLQMLCCYWSSHLPNQFPVSPSPLCSPLSYFKIPFLALIFFLATLLHGFSLPCKSLFCSTVATQSGSAVWAQPLGKCSVRQRERRRRQYHCKVAD